MPIAVGALLDFMSGAVPRAPLWLRKTRMEWVYRIAIEPRRLPAQLARRPGATWIVDQAAARLL